MKTVLITGAGSGIGKAAAKMFLADGYNVYAAARRTERMNDLKELGAHIIRLDVCDDLSCRKCFEQICRESGGVDILVNNAGYGEYGPVEVVDLIDAQRQLEVNVYGAVRMAKLVIPYMRENHSGRIINISSAAGRVTTYMGGWYHATKYALEALSDSLRMELHDDGIDVVLIEPGGVRSEWGSIAADNLTRASKGTVYEDRADSVAAAYREMYTPTNQHLTSPEKAARVICRAATARRPKTRYLFGYGAKGLIIAHAVLPNRAFDSLMRRMYNSGLAKRITKKQ